MTPLTRPAQRALAPLLPTLLVLAPLAAQPSVAANGENQRLLSATVTPAGGGDWNLQLLVDDDNSDPGLPNSFRRWWHCEISNLAPNGDTLQIQVRNAGYTDTILPAWAQSTDGGATFGDYTRMPTSATPSTSGGGGSGVHTFTLTTPPGVTDIRIAKWFPYTVTDKDAFIASITGAPELRSVTNIGNSWQGRPIQMLEFTDPSFNDVGKKRIWVHCAVHPAENTAYFMAEGIVDFLLSGSTEAQALLANAIVNIVPMANPDGAFAGNYRTNSRSVNLEEQWTAPYNSPEREIQALRSQIEAFMGTAANPGSNPIELILNLHSTHGGGFPFHFRHQSNSSFDIVSNRTGVVPSVNALETLWIQTLDSTSPLIALGSTQNSTCGAPNRPFVECMMHDRWSIDPAWTGGSSPQEQIMTITLEGTYGPGPSSAWATQEDYRESGRGIGRALQQYFGFTQPTLTASCQAFGAGCNSLFMSCGITNNPPSTNLLDLTVFGAPPGAIGAILVGATHTTFPLPPPFPSGCDLLDFVADASLPLSGPITTVPPLLIPNVPGFLATLQTLSAFPDGGGGVTLQLSNPIEVTTQF